MLKDILITKGLSYRESEVAEQVTKGITSKEIAEKLFVTEKTIKFHLTNIYKKMNVKSRAQLIVHCLGIDGIDGIGAATTAIAQLTGQNTANQTQGTGAMHTNAALPMGAVRF